MTAKDAIEYLNGIDKPFLTPAQASKVLECNPEGIREAAKAGILNIPYQMVGNRTKISRMGLIKFVEGELWETI